MALPGRRGDQVRQGLLRRRRRGRDDPQDDRRGRQGRPGAGHQAGRPAAQHAHPRRPLARLPRPHRPGHPGRAGPAVRPARHPGAQARARGRACCAASSPSAYAADRRLRHAPAGLGRRTSTSVVAQAQAALRREQDRRRRSRPGPGTSTRSGRTPSPAATPSRTTCPGSWSSSTAPETDCYAALGAIHGTWRPVPGRFKDFIASPKNNLYRSLHTTVIGPDDRTVEVLIRTEAMHRDAEYGIARRLPLSAQPGAGGRAAAHRRRAAATGCAACSTGSRRAADPAQFLESLRCDLAEAQIQVFADGRPVLLPAEATPVDLAYELGSRHRRPLRRGHRQRPARPAVLAAGRRRRGRDHHRGRRHDEFDADGSAAGPAPGVAGLRQDAARPAADQPLVRPSDQRAAAHASPTRCGSAGPAIGLALRQHDRGLASDLPLRAARRASSATPTWRRCWSRSPTTTVAADTVVDQLIAMVDQSPRAEAG